MNLAWESWAQAIAAGVRGVPDSTLEVVAREIQLADIVLTAGNGGSASLASHMAQAVLKPDYAAGGGRPAVCLTDGVPTWSAHANDGGWETALAECARPYLTGGLRACVVIFSSSGKSKNVVALAEFATELHHRVVGFTGFDGGALKKLAHVSVHVESENYEVIEPCHDCLLHRVQYHLRTPARLDFGR